MHKAVKEDNKRTPLQSRKAETAQAFTKGKKPKAEKTTHLETQPRSAKKKNAGTDGHVGHEETFHPADFNRFGTNFVTEKATKPGL